MAKLLLTAAAAALLTACAAAPPPEPSHKPTSTGQALAQMTCQFRIAKADAWVNLMPGASRVLHVAVTVSDKDAKFILIKADTSTADQLNLEIRSAEASTMAGQQMYNEPATEPPVKRIALMCRGGEIAAITDIQKVY